MDLQKLIAKMDQIEAKGMNEAITMKDVQAAVGQEKDEQKRANILNDLAWKEKLPGLYDPVSGYFIRKQSPTDNNQISIAATAREADTQALAAMGLVPSTAKTSALGGLVATGKLSNTTDQNAAAEKTVKDQSAKVYGGQASDAMIKDIIPKITALLDKAEQEAAAPAAGSGSPMAGVKETISFSSGIAKALAEGLGFTLKEGAMEELAPLMAQVADIEDPALKPLQDRYAALMNKPAAGGATPGKENPHAGQGGTTPGATPAVSTQGAESSAKFKAEKLARLKEITAKLQASASRAPGKGAAAATDDVAKLKAALAKVPGGDPISANAVPKTESRLSEAEKYAALRDKLLMIETRVDEGLWDAAVKYGGKAVDGVRGAYQAAKTGFSGAPVATGKLTKAGAPQMTSQSSKQFAKQLAKAPATQRAAYNTAKVVKDNPIKTGLGAAAVAGGTAYALSGKPEETPAVVPAVQTGTPTPRKENPHADQGGTTPTPGATDVDDIKALTTEIDAIEKELMGDDGSAFQNDPEIQKAIADAKAAAGGASANQTFAPE